MWYSSDITLLKLKFTLLSLYRKRRKFQGVINFVVFADATIPQNLFLGWRV